MSATTSAGLFGRLESVLNEVVAEVKTASAKQAMDDPGHIDGESSHPSAMPESKANEQNATEGEQTADNAATVKEQTPGVVDTIDSVTPGGAPKDTEQQVTPATPTGEDPSNEDDYKGDKDDPGTSHPASGEWGDKYASITRQSLESMSDEDLFKLASELGNDIVADHVNGAFETKTAAAAKPAASVKPAVKPESVMAAADAGYKVAAALGGDDDDTKLAAAMIEQTSMTAIAAAVKVAHYIGTEMARLQKQAEDADDPMGGGAEGEDHEDERSEIPLEEGGDPAAGGAPAGGADLLAAMGAGGGAPPMDPAAMGGDPAAMGGDPAAMGGDPGAMPPEMSGMSNDQALQQLAMALLELGIDPAALASAAGPGPELGAKVASFKQSGKFVFAEAKNAAERKVRNWMKGFVRELVGRR